MKNNVETLIDEAVINMIKHSSSETKINKLTKNHGNKVHFVPNKYRIFGGILQSLNIQFGNFIEELMELIVKEDGKYEIIEAYSGKKSNKFKISIANETLIDNYITTCQYESDNNVDIAFLELMHRIIENNDGDAKFFKHDIDLLFRNKNTGIYYYLEIKYNDDHDTGKFIDINRKFIKTSAYLINELEITDMNQFKPIIFYFTKKKMKGNIYVPEESNIYRGKKFFDDFLEVKYSDVESYMFTLSEKEETVNSFNDLYTKIMNK